MQMWSALCDVKQTTTSNKQPQEKNDVYLNENHQRQNHQEVNNND